MSGSGCQPEETENEEQERLLSHTHLADLNPDQSIEEGQSHVETRYEFDESCRKVPLGQLELDEMEFPAEGRQIEYKVYKRRWFGLMQLVLLNIVVSWDVSISMH